MGAAGVVTKIFGMFDKIDDIIYEPVKLVCDVFRQPLKKDDLRNDLKREREEQELKKQLDEFEADLEIKKKEREMQLSVEERRLNEEINQMILDSDLARREEMIALDVKYRKEMATAAAELTQIFGNIAVETRSKILALYTEKEKEYLDIQSKYKKDLIDTVKMLRELYPDGTGEDIINSELISQLKLIAERSAAFSTLLNKDMASVFNIINTTISETSTLAQKYFAPTPNDPALTEKVVMSLEKKD